MTANAITYILKEIMYINFTCQFLKNLMNPWPRANTFIALFLSSFSRKNISECSRICKYSGQCSACGQKKRGKQWKNNYPLCLPSGSETKFCPIQSNTKERTRKSERPNMKGLRRPHGDVQMSDHWPITGTVNNATSGAVNKKVIFQNYA